MLVLLGLAARLRNGGPIATARARMGIHQRPRMELISIVAATSVCTPVPVAIDVSVEDSHLVGLFVRR
jgi:hypothetical protein